MNKKIAWVTDSTSSLHPDFIQKHNIHIVPLSIIFGNESFKEIIEISDETFYLKLKDSKELPKSSQPAIGDFVELYEKLKKEYDCAIAIHCSSLLSGTLQSSISAAEIANFEVIAIDSEIGSYPLTKMIEAGVALHENGGTIEEITETLEKMKKTNQLYFAPSSMEQLHKSGRVSGTQAILGNLLNIKIILGFEKGAVVIKDKVRSEKKAKLKIHEYLLNTLSSHQVKEVAIVHSNNLETAEEWKQEFEKKHPEINFIVTPFIPVVAVHTGAGTVGMSWIIEQ